MRLPEEPELPPTVNVTALIDVTFSILAFFVLSSLFLSQNLGISVNLPTATTARPQTQLRVFLSIQRDGKLFLDRQPIAQSQLVPALNRRRQPNQELTVALQADADLPHGRFIEVMDVLRQVKGVKLAIATRRK
jgi:biopolymer transport protein ExbD